MGAQPSSSSRGAVGGNGRSMRMLGSSKAASFAPATEPMNPLSHAFGHARSASSSSNLDEGIYDLEVGPPQSPQSKIEKQLEITSDEEASPRVKPHASSMKRRPSKMSVESVGSKEDSTASVASQQESRPTSAQSGRSFAASRSESFCGSRPASASSRLAAPKPVVIPRDPAFAQAQMLAKRSLEKLEDQDFIGGRRAWGGYSGGYTPSTASPASVSRASSSISGSSCGSRPTTCASSTSGSTQGNDPNARANVKDAKQRAKAQFAALQSELRGSAGATPARYSTWPVGCAVRVVGAPHPANVGGAPCDDLEPEGALATLVRYDSLLNVFEVQLEDGSTRLVPAQRVTRVRPRDRASASKNLGGPPLQQSRTPLGVQSKDHRIAASVARGVHEPSGYKETTPWNMFDSGSLEMPAPESRTPPVAPMQLMSHDMLVQQLEESASMPIGQMFDFETALSLSELQPQMLGRAS